MRFITCDDTFINHDHILHIKDVDNIFSDDVFQAYDEYYIEEFYDLFNEKGFPGTFIGDMTIRYEDVHPKMKYLGLPLWLEYLRHSWTLQEFENINVETNYCFNFMINKKKISRYLCIKLVELFEFDNFIYTWSGVDNNFDCSDIIKEYNNLQVSPLTADQFSKILAPITLDPIFHMKENIEQDTDPYNIKYGGNRNSWDWGCNKLFSHSAVSLITESLNFQKATMFTEKTMYPVLGLTFPIWVGGGNQQAETWKEIGFDAFDDVINHDYQYYDTLLERCVYAFTLNKRILTDIDYASSMRNSHLQRLKNNRSLLLSGQLSKYTKKELNNHFANSSPDDSFKKSMNQFLKHFYIDTQDLDLCN
jgi:hypothetical protein